MTLDELRQSIDKLDDQLLDLLNERMNLVRQVGELKKHQKSVIYRPEREKAILDRLKNQNYGLLNAQAIEAIFMEIFAVSRNLELPEKIAYLGPNGSFSHQAAESRFGAMSEYLPISNIRTIFETVDTGRARFGVVPIENNQEGVVPDTIDSLAEFDLHIVAEVPIPIHFSFASEALRIGDIKRVYSRDIAFRQCRKFIQEIISNPDVEQIPVDSTSKAARLAKNDSESAAICSHIAAHDQGLPIYFENIEDSGDNYTRFLIISKDFENAPSGNDKTSILAKIAHADEPGSLARFLLDFDQEEINLTKIESRPAKQGKNFTYWFFIDFEGHFQEERIKKVLDKHQKEIKWLGSYVKMV